jgi:hypothetical protein
VHGHGDHGFVPRPVATLARQQGTKLVIASSNAPMSMRPQGACYDRQAASSIRATSVGVMPSAVIASSLRQNC